MPNTFVKTFLISIALVATLIYTTCYWSWLVYPERFPLVQYDEEIILPTELPDTGVEVWNWDCSSYWTNSYWKDSSCYTPKWVRVFNDTTHIKETTSFVCTIDTNTMKQLMHRIDEVQKQYTNVDYVCADIVAIENELKKLIDNLWTARNKVKVDSKRIESAYFVEFPAPTIKYITKTVFVKTCSLWFKYEKVLDACMPTLSPFTGIK